MSKPKTIEVKLEGVNYTIQFKDTQPKETIVFDDTGKEYFRKAKSLLREKAKQLGMSANGYLYNSNGEEWGLALGWGENSIKEHQKYMKY